MRTLMCVYERIYMHANVWSREPALRSVLAKECSVLMKNYQRTSTAVKVISSESLFSLSLICMRMS